MGAKYHSVSPNLWDKKFRSLNANVQRIYLYIRTCRHRHSEGLFPLPIEYVKADTGASGEEVAAAFDSLTKEGFITYDWENEVVLDRLALHEYEPAGPKQITGALNKIEQVPRTPLKEELLKVAFVSAPDFAEHIVAGFPELARVLDRKGTDTPSEDYSQAATDTPSIPRVRDRQLEGESEFEKEVARIASKHRLTQATEAEVEWVQLQEQAGGARRWNRSLPEWGPNEAGPRDGRQPEAQEPARDA